MPDITMCTNEDCPYSTICYRAICEPSEYSQSYSDFKPVMREGLFHCDYFMDKPDHLKSDREKLFNNE